MEMCDNFYSGFGAADLLSRADRAGVLQEGPADAESCCGDSKAELRRRLEDLVANEFRVPLAAPADPACKCRSASPVLHGQQLLQQQHRPQQDKQQSWSHGQTQQQRHQTDGSVSCGQSSGGCSTGTVHMGDDFECMASEDVSMLLEDTAEYPGGVEAALADWADACSQDNAVSTSAGLVAEQSLAPAFQPLPPVAHFYQHQHQATNGMTMPSLAALLLSPSPPPCYAANMLPCCQWGSIRGRCSRRSFGGKGPSTGQQLLQLRRIDRLFDG